MAPAGSTTYHLVVSRGYIRLVRHGRRESSRLTGLKFAKRDGDWVPVDPTADPEQLEAWDLEVATLPGPGEVDAADAWWIDEADPDPYLESAIDDARHPRRGDRGQSARSRMNMRRCPARHIRSRTDPEPTARHRLAGDSEVLFPGRCRQPARRQRMRR